MHNTVCVEIKFNLVCLNENMCMKTSDAHLVDDPGDVDQLGDRQPFSAQFFSLSLLQ